MKEIPEHLEKKLKIIFVGFNPSIISSEAGHHYANPTNRFWKVLFEAGLTTRKFSPEEDRKLLELGYGLTNIVERPTKGANDITKEEFIEGRKKLREKIEYYRPKVVCFVGKGVYQQYSGIKRCNWGKQDQSMVDGVIDFVAPSTSGLVRLPINEIVTIYKQLKSLVK